MNGASAAHNVVELLVQGKAAAQPLATKQDGI
jgi:hypothetical protein